MDGVTILNTYKTLSDGSAILLGFGVAFIAILSVAGFVTLYESCDWKDKATAMFLLASAFGLALGLYCIVKPVQYYEVILNENVKWQEFTEHYEVKNARGKILIVREVKDATD